MSKTKKDCRRQIKKQKAEQVTLPVSDTVPAPGNFAAGVLNLYGQGLPVLDSTELISTMGAGTAEDVVSALQAPVPGRDANQNGQKPY